MGRVKQIYLTSLSKRQNQLCENETEGSTFILLGQGPNDLVFTFARLHSAHLSLVNSLTSANM